MSEAGQKTAGVAWGVDGAWLDGMSGRGGAGQGRVSRGREVARFAYTMPEIQACSKEDVIFKIQGLLKDLSCSFRRCPSSELHKILGTKKATEADSGSVQTNK
ncbi:Protein of unknown function [Gryllus bimaculatus]|nr:Protein of unknown function [Gryllus bimaculatus]